jgi:hypothetical protein
LLLIVTFIVWLPFAAYLAYKWWKIFNSPDGERYLKRRIQGPFVPFSRDEIAADAARRTRT